MCHQFHHFIIRDESNYEVSIERRKMEDKLHSEIKYITDVFDWFIGHHCQGNNFKKFNNN